MEELEKAYYGAAYRVTKAILSPVVDAISDSVSEATQRGVHEALQNLSPAANLWDLFIGKKK
jgi:ABC-type transporter lipoprotein component MlaA